MIPVLGTVRWIARACFQGWRTLRRALSLRRPTPPPPRPVVTHLASGIDVTVRLDQRLRASGSVAPDQPDTARKSPSGATVPSASSASATDPAHVERRLQEAWNAELARAERHLLKGGFIPGLTRHQATGAVFQGTVTSSTDPNLVAWVSAAPRSR